MPVQQLGGSKGLEPSLPAFTVRCSAHLSYDPQKGKDEGERMKEKKQSRPQKLFVHILPASSFILPSWQGRRDSNSQIS